MSQKKQRWDIPASKNTGSTFIGTRVVGLPEDVMGQILCDS